VAARRRRWPAPLLVLCLTGTLAGPWHAARAEAQAAPSAVTPEAEEQAAELFEKGRAAFEAQNHATAAQFFVEAYRLDPDARLAFNAATAFERAGDPVRARTWYETAQQTGDAATAALAAEALARVTPASEAIAAREAEAEERRRAAEREAELQAARGRLRLDLGSAIEGAIARIDDGPALALPTEVALDPGQYLVSFEAPGYQSWSRPVEIQRGGVVVIDAQLRAESRAGLYRALGWSAIGLAAGTGAAGVLFYGDAADRYDRARELSTGPDREAFESTRDQGRASGTFSTASYAVSAAAAIGGTVLLLLARSASADDEAAARGQRVSLAPWFDAGGSGLVSTWRF
jgi:tetratricopeptide (TPR) repeat protein